MIYYLYVKQHNGTGLKYLGQTKKSDPYKYKGSGVRWLNHIKVHGDNITTELIAAFDNREDLSEAGKFWSRHWNVVKSDEWANLKEESGNGGMFGYKQLPETIAKRVVKIRGKPRSVETRRKLSEANKGKHHTEETKQKLKGYTPWNKGKIGVYSEEARQKISQSNKRNVPWNKGKQTRVAPWNKGKTGVYSEETRRKMSLALMGNTNAKKERV